MEPVQHVMIGFLCGLMVQLGAFRADPSYRNAPTVSHVLSSMGKMNELKLLLQLCNSIVSYDVFLQAQLIITSKLGRDYSFCFGYKLI